MAILVTPSTNYPTVQSALDAAISGDTVSIITGIYEENLSLIGKDNITIASNGAATIFVGSVIGGIGLNVSGNNISIYNLVFTNYFAGCYVYGNNNVIKSVITLQSATIGFIIEGDNNKLLTSETMENKAAGIAVSGNNNLYEANRIKYNPIGIVVPAGSFKSNIISKNIFIQNTDFSIRISSPDADKNVITYNTINGSLIGILSEYGSVAVISNTITNCLDMGIKINSNYNVIAANNLINNSSGMILESNSSLISGNTIQSGDYTGLLINGYKSNLVSNVIYGYKEIGLLLNGDENNLCYNKLLNNCTNIIDNGMNIYCDIKCDANGGKNLKEFINRNINNRDYSQMFKVFDWRVGNYI